MKASLLSAAFVVLAAPAFAATISVSSFSKSAYDAAVGSMASSVIEDFEGYDEGNVARRFSTAVGKFSKLGGTGSGGTISNAGFANDGDLLAIRDGNVYGRTSTTSALSGNSDDDMFLDSNDTFGIVWKVKLDGGKMFDRVVFTIKDAAEFGGKFGIKVDDASAQIVNGSNAVVNLIEIDFGRAMSRAKIKLGHFKGSSPFKRKFINDGFSIDDIAVSEVPLPASALLLLGGLGGLAAVRRRKG